MAKPYNLRDKTLKKCVYQRYRRSKWDEVYQDVEALYMFRKLFRNYITPMSKIFMLICKLIDYDSFLRASN